MPQPTAAYLPGTASAVIGANVWLLVNVAPDSPLATLLEQALREEGGEAVALDALARSGLSQLPSFALVASAGEVLRVIVRGDAVVRITTDDGISELAAHGLTTWRESAAPLADLSSAWLSLGPSEPSGLHPAPPGSSAAAAIELRWEPAAGSASADDAAPLAQPEAEPDTHGDGTVMWSSTTRSALESALAEAAAPPPEVEAPVVEVEAPVPPTTDDSPEPEDNYDFLFGSTTSRTIEDAVVRHPDDEAPDDEADRMTVPMPQAPPAAEPPPPPASPPPPPPAAQPAAPAAPLLGEEDATRARRRVDAALPPLPHDPRTPIVMAVRCSADHFNPPHASTCRTCRAGIPPQDAIAVPRPPLGRLVVSTGASVVLDRDVILGRSPTWQPPGERPHLIKLADPSGELSRNHIAVEIEGWQVAVRDLNSTNGTVVGLPGRQPQTLGKDERLAIAPGTTVTLAPDVSFVFEAGP